MLSTVVPPFGPVLMHIALNQLASKKEFTKKIKIQDCRPIASYNWIPATTASIVVPGLPPRWTPLRWPKTLKPDDGIYYRDQNARQNPDHPMEAAILSILEAKESTKLGRVDLIACSRTLGNLLRFSFKDARPFRMLVYKVGETVHFVRRENTPQELIPDVRGYGHTFPEAYTTWDKCVPSSESHQRIISYNLDGINCLVRFESDGYLPENNDVEIPRKSYKNYEKGPAIDEITSFLSETVVFRTRNDPSSKNITISLAGVLVDQDSLFDLKTRSVRRKLEEAEMVESEIPKLWIKQIPNFILAFHHRGKFDDIQVKDVTSELHRWETQHQQEITSFSNLLATIIEFARNTTTNLEICFTEDNPDLQIREQVGDLRGLCSAGVQGKWATFIKKDYKKGENEKERI